MEFVVVFGLQLSELGDAIHGVMVGLTLSPMMKINRC